MIHIQQDPCAVRSAGLIADGLTACLARMPFGEVTVTSVCRAAGVGRATFYRLFDNTADVLDYRCGQAFTAMPDASEEPPALRFIRLWMDNRVLLQAIVESRQNALLEDAHRRYVLPHSPALQAAAPEDARYLSAMLTACLCAFLSAWLRGGGQESPEALYDRLRQCFCTLSTLL